MKILITGKMGTGKSIFAKYLKSNHSDFTIVDFDDFGGDRTAFESEKVLFHIEMVMHEWGYRSPLVSAYCDSIKKENDIMREMGIEE